MSEGEGDTNKEWAALRAIADEAGPAGALRSPHVAGATLERIRRDESTPDLDPAYAHLASCAACRARLLEPAAAVERVARGALGAAGSDATVVPLRPLRPRRSAVLGWLAAAAAFALVAGVGVAALRSTSSEPLAVTQRSYAGMMGGSELEPPGVAPEDRDLELSFVAPPAQDAALVIVDASGRAIAPVGWFSRAGSDRETLVLAPRTFVPHSGSAFGFVLAGDRAKIEHAIGALGALAPAASLETYESSLRSVAPGVRVQRIRLGF